MKIPKSIKIVGHTYQVVFDEHLWHRDNVHGNVMWSTQIISLDPYGHPQVIEQTFIHEVMHAIDKHVNNKALTEDEVDSMSEGWQQVLNDMGIIFER